MVGSREGNETRVQLNSDGTTIDHDGLVGIFTNEGSVLSVRDDVIITVEFKTSNPQPSDTVTISLKPLPNSPLTFGPIQATVNHFSQ